MAITSTNTVSSDIAVSITETNGNTTKTEIDSLGYSLSFTQGTGVGEVNGQAKVTGIVPSGGTLVIDFEAISKDQFGAPYTLDFDQIKGFVFYNEGTQSTDTFSVRATGSNALTGIFNGGTGDFVVKPYGTFTYSDYYGDLTSSSTHRNLHFVNNSDLTDGLAYSYIVVGTTG